MQLPHISGLCHLRGLNQFHLAFLADLMESDPRLYLHEYIIKFEEEFNLATPCMVESTMFQILEYLDSTCKVMYRENPQANLGQEFIAGEEEALAVHVL